MLEEFGKGKIKENNVVPLLLIFNDSLNDFVDNE